MCLHDIHCVIIHFFYYLKLSIALSLSKYIPQMRIPPDPFVYWQTRQNALV